VSLALAVLLAPLTARANMGKAVIDGEHVGVLAPDNATAVRVDHEALDFVLSPQLATAEVTATYRLTNAGAAPEAADVAFSYVRGDADRVRLGEHATVTLDGAPVQVHSTTDADLLRTQLEAWLKAHPGVDGALPAAAANDAAAVAELAKSVAAAGGRCDGPCRGLVAWYKGDERDPDQTSPDIEDAEVVAAAREALPDAAASLARDWSTLPDAGGARLGFLLFHVDLSPGPEHTLAVRYRQRATVDREERVNPTYRFDYLLSPARRWASFGPIDVAVHVPASARFASPLPFHADGDAFRATLPTLPDGELSFDAMSTDGLWFGMTDSRGYWAILMVAMAAVTALVGGASARFSRGASGFRRVLLPVVTAGPLAAACNVAVLVLLLGAFPPAALGFGYGGLAGGALLVLLSLPLGALAAVYRARRSAD